MLLVRRRSARPILNRMAMRCPRPCLEPIYCHHGFPASKATVFDEIAQYVLANMRLIKGHGNRLRDVAGVYLLNRRQRSQSLLDTPRTGREVQPLDGERDGSHVVPPGRLA